MHSKGALESGNSGASKLRRIFRLKTLLILFHGYVTLAVQSGRSLS